MPEESRERHSCEYVERKLLHKRLAVLEVQLDALESFALQRCLDGKPLDLRNFRMTRMFSLWAEQQTYLVVEFRKNFTAEKAGEHIKEIRMSASLAKTELAKLLGITEKTYASYENGLSKFR